MCQNLNPTFGRAWHQAAAARYSGTARNHPSQLLWKAEAVEGWGAGVQFDGKGALESLSWESYVCGFPQSSRFETDRTHAGPSSHASYILTPYERLQLQQTDAASRLARNPPRLKAPHRLCITGPM